MKALNWFAWLAFGAGCLVILLAAISLVMGKNLFGFTHIVNYFNAANSFFLMAIPLFIFVNRCECKKG